MQLSKDQVQKVAKLANLPITEAEEQLYGEQLSAILGYIETLQKVDTAGVTPTYNVTGTQTGIFQDQKHTGETIPSMTQSEALQNAPVAKNGLFVTKGVFAEE